MCDGGKDFLLPVTLPTHRLASLTISCQEPVPPIFIFSTGQIRIKSKQNMLNVKVPANRNDRPTHQHGHSRSPDNAADLVAVCQKVEVGIKKKTKTKKSKTKHLPRDRGGWQRCRATGCSCAPSLECLLWDQLDRRHHHKTVWVNINRLLQDPDVGRCVNTTVCPVLP